MAGHEFSHVPRQVNTIETKYRRIVTKLPVPESIPMLERLYRLESRSMHGQLPVIWDRAEDFSVYDAWGNRWIDFTSTIFVANAGHGNKRIQEALRKVIDKPLFHTYTYATKERLDYLEYLHQVTPDYFEKSFLLSAGTEATECALKLMRLNGQKKGKRKGGIVCIEGNWHGRTMGAQVMGWNPAQKEWIGHVDPNIHHIPFPYPWNERAKADPVAFFQKGIDEIVTRNGLDPSRDLCGFMLETFQGWGAVFYPAAFVQAVSAYAKKHDCLVTFDEMQAGFGRTGELFGYMHYGVKPDLVCLGKGASSSLPLSIVLGSAEVMDLPDIGSMSSTHSANPMVCAAGKANLEALIEDGLIENSKNLGLVFHEHLNALQQRFPEHISSVQGRGLLAAVIFKDPSGKPLSSLCDEIAEECLFQGLLVVHTGRESIKLAPPLSIHKEALLEGLKVFADITAEKVALT